MARELKGIVVTYIALLGTAALAEIFSDNEMNDLISWKGVNGLSLNSYSDPNVNSHCKKYSICNHVDNYPTALAKWALEEIRTRRNMVKYTVEKKINEGAREQITQLCPSQEEILYPTAALSQNGGWYFILNLPDHRFQGYHVDKCNNTVSSCRGVSNPSACEQVYTHRPMYYLNLKEQFANITSFKVPSCCSCAVEF